MRIALLPILYIITLPSCFLANDSETFEINESGLLYRFHERHYDITPEVGDEIYYSMTVRDGRKALNSKHKSELMPLSPKKNPILQAFQLMGKGDSMTIALFVDSLPKRMIGNFEAGDTMFVDLRIINIRKKNDIELEIIDLQERADKITMNAKEHIANFLKGNLGFEKTKSGLQYVIEDKGKGKSVKDAKRISLHYAVFLKDGKELESTFRKAKPKAFYFDNRTQAVPGFIEGLQLLNAGGKATLIIPFQLAYGDLGRGPIPPKSDMIIYVEVLEAY